VVQIGLGGEPTIPLNLLVSKEVTLRGSFRFHDEFAWAARFIASGAIDVTGLLTEVVPLADSRRAFELAGDRTRAMKVQLAF
jgi:L-idonate 5-dehydrogenase